ncbi:MAG TPA: hypothetical protein PKE27_14935 [Povalibacter sp.]|uniref:hypothetical protein n=1 Tax=Povalibacter sp. TaxID=1962978 RepID=UPI002CA44BD8|nr:hypothetical protein [Povalibacter sp.]HMN45871.1 hypothetical protein [Povalibacter sp.]
MKVPLIIVSACLFTGCSMIQQMMPGHREAVRQAEELRNLNLRVMRFADEYAGRVTESATEFQQTSHSAEERLDAQNWKAQQAQSVYMIASGPNPISNSLDMVVLATLSRMVLDDLWVDRTYGTRAQQVRETHRAMEDSAWKLAVGVLTEPQATQLRQVIRDWRAANPQIKSVGFIHFQEFAKSIGHPRPGESSSPGNLFSLFGLDPFAELDPAVREITQTREMAERAIFYLQRMPGLLDIQVQRVAYQFAVTPEARSALASIDRVSLVGSAADQFVDSLPEVLDEQREALLSQFMRELDDRQQTVRALSSDLRSTLQAGTETAESVHAAFETFDRIAARFPVRSGQGAAQAERFDITQYTQMLRELAVTIRELDALSRNAAAAAPALDDAMQAATGRLEGIVDRVFLYVLLIIVTATLAAWGGAIAYRAAVMRMRLRAGADH